MPYHPKICFEDIHIQNIRSDDSKKNIKKIWLADYKYNTIVKSYKEAKEQSFYNNLYDAARARQISDWLIGINSTRTLTVSSGMNTTLTLGRVQTAVLSLIVERYKNHINFVPQDTYTPEILFYNLPFPLSYNTTFFESKEADTIIDLVKKTPTFNLKLEEEIKVQLKKIGYEF
jgi:DNA topoisomerase-3